MEKRELIEILKRRNYLKSGKVEKAFREVDRESFVPEKYRSRAYNDSPLPIGSGQTISAPHMVCITTELLDVRKEDKILEIGTGRGYQSAILSKIASKVITMEKIPELYKIAVENLRSFDNVEIVLGDGSKGYEKEAPYDGIIVTCAVPELPISLKNQVKSKGIIVIPEGGEDVQQLMVYSKDRDGWKKKNYGAVRFVPMKGELGF